MDDERSEKGPNENGVLTIREAAARLRVHPYTIYDLLKSDRLVGFKLRRRWRILESSLRKFMERDAKDLS